MPKDFPVNLGDPKEIREKMPEIRHLLVEARDAQATLKEQEATLREQLAAQNEQVELLERIVGQPVAGNSGKTKAKAKAKARKTEKSSARKAAPSQEQGIRALERAGRRMGPTELFRFMESHGMDMPTSIGALNARLWTAAKAGRAIKHSDNTYSPAGGFPPSSNGHAQLPDPTATNGATGLQAQPTDAAAT